MGIFINAMDPAHNFFKVLYPLSKHCGYGIQANLQNENFIFYILFQNSVDPDQLAFSADLANIAFHPHDESILPIGKFRHNSRIESSLRCRLGA